jgi:hypothetical protein
MGNHAPDRPLSATMARTCLYAASWLVLGAGTPGLRREPQVDFAVDRAYLASGNIQYFFQLAAPGARPSNTPALAHLVALDFDGEWARRDREYHVFLNRMVFVVDKDISFFTQQQLSDVDYMNSVLPGFEISRLSPTSFRAQKMPACTFELTYRGRDAAPLKPALLLGDEPGERGPEVLQHNHDFARVMGFQTSRMSMTLTSHRALAPGKTLIDSSTFGLVYNLPPAFLGGEERIQTEARDAAVSLAQHMQSFPTPAHP